MLNRSGHPYLVPYLRGKAFILSPLDCDEFLVDALYQVEEVPFYS